MKIGVLSFQGSVAEHLNHLHKIPGVTPLPVKSRKDFEEVKGFILPGGESTTLGKLLVAYQLLEPIRQAAAAGMPIWGTCAGAILLAKEILNEQTVHIGVMDIKVRRNAYGTQKDSFVIRQRVPEVSSEEIPLVFIRAPIIEAVGLQANVLCEVSGNIVAARQGNLLATTFHPELTEDDSFHRYFVDMCTYFPSLS